jgi:LPS export ABC transporter protein LptC
MMRRMKDEGGRMKAEFSLGFLLVAIAFILICAGCTDLTTPKSGEPAPGEVPEQELYDATIRFYQDDAITSILHAGRIRKFAKRNIVLLDSNLVVDFYNSEGKHTIRLWADSGQVDQVRNDLKAMGNVVAKSDSNQLLETELLRWENRTRHIVTEMPIKFSSPTDTIYGSSFVSDEHLRNRQIDQPTGVTFREMQKRVGQKPRPETSHPFEDDSLPRTQPDSLR